MKILFDHPNPFLLAHGGFQIQLERTFEALQAKGINVEYLRWWDDTQGADIIHYFGRPGPTYLWLAQQKGIKIVLGELLTGLGSRSAGTLRLQKNLIALLRGLLPGLVTARFGWDAFRRADACVALTQWEGHLMQYIFGADPARVHVVPNGVEKVFLESPPASRGPWLVCTATITERKRIVELAQAAVLAGTPVWIIGKPYAETHPYHQQFLALARQAPTVLRYEGAIEERRRLAEIYREARGFVLLSDRESLSLSALEAAACECPLLLTDLPWARTAFGESVSYCPMTSSTPKTAEVLRRFYDAAPALKVPPKPCTWLEVADRLKTLYASLLSTSR